MSLQCDYRTGKCRCKAGTIGDKCDRCGVDTQGRMPQCEPCGECYYQWKVTLDYLSQNTSVELARALNLSVSGPGEIMTRTMTMILTMILTMIVIMIMVKIITEKIRHNLLTYVVHISLSQT